MAEPNRPFVTIVMPALDEERYIAAAIASVLPAEDAGFDHEIIVADGGSADRTGAIVRLIARGQGNLRLIDNPGRSQAAGMNLAAALADPRATVLVRVDCHASYPPGFVATCLAALDASGAASVVVPMVTVGVTPLQRAIAGAQNSRVGNGGSAHRVAEGRSGYVEHGHHAAFLRSAFAAVGGYDETFPANEDAELDARLAAAGGRIWMCREAAIQYYPRATLSSLALQYARYGEGRARTVGKTGMRLRPRQLMPLLILAVVAPSLALGVLAPAFAAPALGYAAACAAWGLVLAARQRRPCLALSGPAAMVMHLAWAVGFLRGALGTPRRAPVDPAGARLARPGVTR